jgi:hypothetical protein
MSAPGQQVGGQQMSPMPGANPNMAPVSNVGGMMTAQIGGSMNSLGNQNISVTPVTASTMGMMNTQVASSLSMAGGQVQQGQQVRPGLTQAISDADKHANMLKIQQLKFKKEQQMQQQQQQQQAMAARQQMLAQQQQQQQLQQQQQQQQQQRIQMTGMQPQQPQVMQTPTNQQQLRHLLLNQQQQMRQQQQQQMMMQQQQQQGPRSRAPNPQQTAMMGQGAPPQGMPGQPGMPQQQQQQPQPQPQQQNFGLDDFALTDILQ